MLNWIQYAIDILIGVVGLFIVLFALVLVAWGVKWAIKEMYEE